MDNHRNRMDTGNGNPDCIPHRGRQGADMTLPKIILIVGTVIFWLYISLGLASMFLTWTGPGLKF